MHITLVDDSIAFDGYTASSRPLGGAEKAFAALAGALAKRGHAVSVYNHCRWALTIEGAHWERFDQRRPLATDLLIAFRKTALLEFVRGAKQRVFWHVGPGRLLEGKSARARLNEHKPRLLLTSAAQNCPRAFLLPPAVKGDFLAPRAFVGPAPPIAMVTTHPAQGLDRLLDLWEHRIRPSCPDARLQLHSMLLAKHQESGEIAPELAPLAARVAAMTDHGVSVIRPQGDTLMAEAWGQAAVHLYPGDADDVSAFTLMESQAAGVPAVVGPLGAAQERIVNGHTGWMAPDDEAFANLAVMLLTNASTRASAGAEARALYQGRTWDAAAQALEAALA